MPLEVQTWGEGTPILFVHGSACADAFAFWAPQRPLAQHRKLTVYHRQGYGESPLHSPKRDFAPDVADIIHLLGEGAHLVGHSYGAVVSLAAAARRPDLVHSLTLMEPPAFDIAASSPAARQVLKQVEALWSRVDSLTTAEFYVQFLVALGILRRPVSLELPPDLERAVQTTLAEPPPWLAELDLSPIRDRPIPTRLISGGWHPAFDAVIEVLEQQLGTERVVLKGARHSPNLLADRFNDLLLKQTE